ncbi:hypothetical protein [Paenibacillus sp. 2003]|uniref:hypothetical protein n=1 Tax=Paenibacillus sp. 2003 TaxID=2817761 RepID=UPI00285E182E|nr:hypothetical protein [Paenibacillus sp. 2003]MDR6720893.1 putative membrane protein [Paenibacillus sp. 2003]
MIRNPFSAIQETLHIAAGTLVGGATGAAVGTIILPGAGTAVGYLIGASGGIAIVKKSKK